MNKHTRGPWKKGNSCIIAEIDLQVPTLIAKTGDYGMGIPAVIPDDEEAEANEMLMIAAPEILEALEALLEDAIHSEYIVHNNYCSPAEIDEMMTNGYFAKSIYDAIAVIAKAKGETT
jgi:hypothetical protein